MLPHLLLPQLPCEGPGAARHGTRRRSGRFPALEALHSLGLELLSPMRAALAAHTRENSSTGKSQGQSAF